MNYLLGKSVTISAVWKLSDGSFAYKFIDPISLEESKSWMLYSDMIEKLDENVALRSYLEAMQYDLYAIEIEADSIKDSLNMAVKRLNFLRVKREAMASRLNNLLNELGGN